MQVIMVIGDGMADRPLKGLNYLTPLEATDIKNMDWLASKGISSLIDLISPELTSQTWPYLATTRMKLALEKGRSYAYSIGKHGTSSDGGLRYNERAAYGGGLGRIQGQHVMPILLNLIGKMEKFGE